MPRPVSAPGDPRLRPLRLLLLLAALWPAAAAAQTVVTDTFDDGDFTQDPAWTGTADGWTVEPLGGSPALRANGPDRADTLALATASTVTYGTWQVTLRYEDGALSNFNLIRIYLLADAADLTGPVNGYFVQLGTNSRDVRLYRSDAARADPRVLLARTDADLLPDEARTLRLTITRTEPGTWSISLDDLEVLTHEEPTPAVTAGRAFGFWIKHSATRGRSYWFDDVQIEGRSGPADTTPPVLLGAEALGAEEVRVRFDEPVDGCDPAHYDIAPGIGRPAAVPCIPEPDIGQSIFTLILASPLTTGTYTLTVRDVADRAGNVLAEAQTTFSYVDEAVGTPAPGDIVVNEIFYDPPDSDLEFIELYNRADAAFDLSRLTFSDDRGQAVPVVETVTALPPDGYAVLVRNADAFAEAFPGVAYLAPPAWPVLNDGGDAVVLRAEATVVDSVAYRPGWGGEGVSLERRDPGGPSNAAANWGSSTDPAGATPGRRNTLFAIDTTPPALLGVTPNATADTLRVRFSEPLDPASVTPDDFRILDGATSVTPAAVATQDTLVLLTVAPPLPTGSYTLDVTDVADLRGNVLTRASRPFDVFRPDPPKPGEIVVNEIFYAPPDADLEFVELYNRSEKTFDLRGFRLADARLEPVPITGAVTRVNPGDYVVLVRNAAVFAEAFPGVAAHSVAPWPALNDGGDAVVLYYGETTIDAVAYAADWGRPGVSLERRDPDGPSDASVNFGPSTAEGGATPGVRNSLFGRDLSPPQPRYAEQTAPAHLRVAFDEPLDPATLVPGAFSLDGRPPAAVLLPAPAEVDLRFDAPIGETRLTIAGVRDLFGNTLAETTLDVARLPEPGTVRINEILFDPLADAYDGRPDQPEYVEVLNTAPYPVSLRHVFRTRRADESGDADTLRWADGFAQVAPGGYAVFFAQPTPTADPAVASTLADAFAGIDFRRPEVTLVPVGRSSLNLRNDADLIRLHRADGTVLDAVPYEAAWHHPGLADTRGLALERIAVDGPSDDAANWSSSTAPSGGTPGLPNTLRLDPAAPPPSPGLTVAPSPFSPDGDGFEDVTALEFTLSAAPALIRTRIFDAQGRLVRTLDEATLAARQGRLIWDGRDDAGRALRIGLYIILLEAVDERSGTVEAFKRPVVLTRAFD